MGKTNKYKLPYPELTDTPDVPRDFASLAQAVEEAIGTSATTQTYKATIATNWTTSGKIVKQVVAVQGITSADNPLVDLITTVDGYKVEQEEYAKIFKAETSANAITFYAYEATTKALSVQIKAVR